MMATISVAHLKAYTTMLFGPARHLNLDANIVGGFGALDAASPTVGLDALDVGLLDTIMPTTRPTNIASGTAQ